VVSFYASSDPDGLEKVAEDIGFIETAEEHTYADGALADYGVKGIENERASVGVAGVIGVIGTAIVGGALFTFIARKPKKSLNK
jgi:cobalt/nickel transport protein